MANSYDRIYAIVRQIPPGKVATYGQVAQLAGFDRGARLAGYALFRVAPDMDVPWQRVINAKGEISDSPFRQGSDYLQRSLLEDEGIVFDQNDRISLAQYRWHPE
ncbi:MAG: methyltransferase [Alkalinema sp. RL_2_19]|nr:methyltransferase [Alkalinema sp. RL_2_19]